MSVLLQGMSDNVSMEFYFLVFVLAVILIIILSILGKFISLWFQAFVSGTPIPLFNIIGMSLRKIPPRVIVNARINLFKAGLKQISVGDLETHYLAGGHVPNVVEALIAADKANIPLDWRRATAIDLAGRDIKAAVQTSVNPRVIDCPSHGGYITGVAKDGIQLNCRARVTVRTNIAQLVGGATEETIVARVGEGIVSAIGGSDTHKQVLESPQRISKLVLEKGLDSSTAFLILSIDIVEINLGENIGAKLRTDQAESDIRIAKAEAEKRRTMAVAQEQENLAKVRDMEAKLVEAQAAVPLAMAEAFRTGKLGIMDYQRIQNIQSDTDMRSALAKPDVEKKQNQG
ncbi:Conserved putative membrane protein [Candidatus Protochlamydia naegleriophila]|uniref:Flotillin-like protein FloA n=1 Tax=Candidatus Protochlamydia naegleriophila TaxID=389348 RepID=A0A0U5JCI7_9BACT|nr:flotillin-like protein FloA [Candidatus Protochlamydia naegleriophila]CUI16516.1 Conserved putative membrane protein [Candidatus Protochlamydia naegleriophila]